jgi:hypothetical protein
MLIYGIILCTLSRIWFELTERHLFVWHENYIIKLEKKMGWKPWKIPLGL